MASRIVFEDDIVSQDLNNSKLHEELILKDEDEDNCRQDLTEKKEDLDFSDIELSSTKDSEELKSVILLGSRVPKTDEIPVKNEGNSQSEGNIGKGKPKGKRKNKTELEMLLIDIEKKDYEVDGNYDEKKSRIFRKQKIKTEEPISYKEIDEIKIKRHISKLDETELICPVCKKELENKVAYRNHLRIHNKTVQEYTCSLCNKKFTTNTDLIAHKQSHSKESFFCHKCKLAFSNHCDFLLHNYEHLDQPHFKCQECGLHCRKNIYKVHVTTHFEKYLNCHLCSFVTNNDLRLQKHINQHTNKFTCVECGKVVNNKEMYNYHMSVHTRIKKYQCLYCGTGFRTTTARNVHTRMHTGEKPFSCNICNYKARQSTDLLRHKETHGEKKFTCDECGKKFLHKFSLAVHIRSHSKKSLYKCTECDGQFVSAGGLRVHSLFKHTSERPFECKPCDRKFINHNQYRKHCRAKYHLRNMYTDPDK